MNKYVVFAGEVKENLTLIACWYKVVAEGKKEVISAEYVFEMRMRYHIWKCSRDEFSRLFLVYIILLLLM